ncbi:MAG: hypothetical protein KGL74_12680 [Elusimicrobia bacterium]|nr:hypothetical protein [Elusimicrobiota bacterium]
MRRKAAFGLVLAAAALAAAAAAALVLAPYETVTALRRAAAWRSSTASAIRP